MGESWGSSEWLGGQDGDIARLCSQAHRPTGPQAQLRGRGWFTLRAVGTPSVSSCPHPSTFLETKEPLGFQRTAGEQLVWEVASKLPTPTCPLSTVPLLCSLPSRCSGQAGSYE